MTSLLACLEPWLVLAQNWPSLYHWGTLPYHGSYHGEDVRAMASCDLRATDLQVGVSLQLEVLLAGTSPGDADHERLSHSTPFSSPWFLPDC